MGITHLLRNKEGINFMTNKKMIETIKVNALFMVCLAIVIPLGYSLSFGISSMIFQINMMGIAWSCIKSTLPMILLVPAWDRFCDWIGFDQLAGDQ